MKVHRICLQDVTILSVRQGLAKWLGHAILFECFVIGEVPLVLVLPDVTLEKYTADQAKET